MEVIFYIIFIPIAIMIVIGTLFYFPFRFGQGGLTDGGDEKHDISETPDKVFIRGTKGVLVLIGAYFVFVGLIASSTPSDSDQSLVFTSQSFITVGGLIVPMIISFLLGIWSAYIAAKKRIT